jgi:hypothetical protein
MPELINPQIPENIFFVNYLEPKFTREDYRNWDKLLTYMNDSNKFEQYQKKLKHHKNFFRYKFNDICLKMGKVIDPIRYVDHITPAEMQQRVKKIEKIYQQGVELVKKEYPKDEITSKLGILERNKASFIGLCEKKRK